jgi:hypothetical protein
MATPKLFHYTRPDAALEHILPSGRLRFGHLPSTNDPREFAPVWSAVAGFVGDEPLTTRSPFELIEEASELLRGSVHLLCLTEDRPSPWKTKYGYGNGPRRARMWAQYSANHTGVCLCFDRQRLIDAAHDQLETGPDRTVLDRPVRYLNENEAPRGLTLIQPEAERDLPAYIEAMVEQNPHDLFFTKDWDWSSETEYRFLLRGATKEEESIDVREALEAVIVGPKFHPVYRPGLYKLCEELEVKALEIQWEMGPPVVVGMRDPGDQRLTDPAS